MRLRFAVVSGLAVLSLFAFQGRYRRFSDYEDAPLPPDANEKTEWAFARLRYPSGQWGWGYGRGSWTTDYPKADRQFVQGVRRLTRLHTRSVEQVVDLDSDEIYNWPWVYAVEVGHWNLTDSQCKRLREYLLRGGFLMTDDFHGSYEWDVFMASMSRVFPERPVVDIDSKDQIFHVLYDLDERVQVPGIQFFYSGRTYERDGVEPRWRGIYDDKGRLMAAICYNQDNGDAWEWADSPRYPEKYASQAYRVGINYVIYAMTH
ncbi:MAG: DUF4159 domain-containing protein [Bryobacteraceae bacterium]